MLLVVDDWNAKVGEQQVVEESSVGKFGLAGEREVTMRNALPPAH